MFCEACCLGGFLAYFGDFWVCVAILRISGGFLRCFGVFWVFSGFYVVLLGVWVGFLGYFGLYVTGLGFRCFGFGFGRLWVWGLLVWVFVCFDFGDFCISLRLFCVLDWWDLRVSRTVALC